MNRPLPRGDFRHRRSDPGGPYRSRAVPRPRGLVGGVAAAASQPRFGHPSRTFGPRAFGRRRLSVGGQYREWGGSGAKWGSRSVIGQAEKVK